MKKMLLFSVLLVTTFMCFAQDQHINGTLRVTNNLVLKNDLLNSDNYENYSGRITFGEGGNTNSDAIFMARYNIKKDISELRISIGDDTNDKFIVGRKHCCNDTPFEKMLVVHTSGKVGIMTENPKSTLDVNGTIRSKEVKIEATGWSDFVFGEDYKLPTLSEVENHIKEHKHLPDLPSEKQVIEEGINVVEMQAKLLQKIEELTLYVIQQDKKYDDLNKKYEGVKQELKELKKE